MALFSFLKGRAEPGATPAKTAAAHGATPNSVEEVRTRARRRLIGAAVLVLGSVVGLPMIFESKPREVPADAAVEMPRGDGLPAVIVPVAKTPVIVAPAPVAAASAALPGDAALPKVAASAGIAVAPKPGVAPPPAEAIVTEAAGDAGRELTAPVPKPAVKPSPKPVVKAEAKPEESAKAERAAAAAAAEARRAKALLEGREEQAKSAKVAKSVMPAAAEKSLPVDKAEKLNKPADKPAAATAATTGSGKFLVQVGAFSQSNSAQAAVDQVEKLGLKAYSQDVETPNGKRTRVRLGPFASREEADRAAARLRAGGQAAAVLPQ